jgi:hypothetical protein
MKGLDRLGRPVESLQRERPRMEYVSIVRRRLGGAVDIANLFISDGSQFTSSGAENPTLTIVALTIRQADYLADQLGKKQI